MINQGKFQVQFKRQKKVFRGNKKVVLFLKFCLVIVWLGWEICWCSRGKENFSIIRIFVKKITILCLFIIPCAIFSKMGQHTYTKTDTYVRSQENPGYLVGSYTPDPISIIRPSKQFSRQLPYTWVDSTTLLIAP